jgi:hypothetical protein
MSGFELDIRIKRSNWMKATSRWSHVRYKATFSGCVKSGTSESHQQEKQKAYSISEGGGRTNEKKKRALTHASPILLCLAQLDFFQFLLLRALGTAFPTHHTLLFQFCIVSREPDVRDELMKFGQS